MVPHAQATKHKPTKLNLKIMARSAASIEAENFLQKEEMDHSHNELCDSTVSLSSIDSTELATEENGSDLLRPTEGKIVELHDTVQQRKKSVRFSQVHTRKYSIIDEPPDDVRDIPRRTLGWDYLEESQIDIEAHTQQIMIRRKEKYAILIHEHIMRAQREKEVKENEKAKKKGWKARVKRALKPMGQSFLEAAGRSNYMMPPVPL